MDFQRFHCVTLGSGISRASSFQGFLNLTLRHRDIRFDLFSHAETRFYRVAQRFVEGFDVFICADDLQVDFHAAALGQGACAQAPSAMCRVNRYRVQPATMAFVSGEHGADNFVFCERDKKEIVLDRQFVIDSRRGCVMCRSISQATVSSAYLPHVCQLPDKQAPPPTQHQPRPREPDGEAAVSTPSRPTGPCISAVLLPARGGSRIAMRFSDATSLQRLELRRQGRRFHRR